MSMNDCNDTGFPQSSHFGGQTAYHNRPQSRFRNRPCSSIHSDFDIKKSRMHLSVNRGKISVPYKSEMCLLFQRGKCFYGENCHFSHSVTDIRKPGIYPVGMTMRVCHWFSSGVDCPYGDRCQFLHKCDQKTRMDVGLYRESSGVNAVSGGIDRSGKNLVESWGMNEWEDNNKMVSGKTKLCSNWERFGSCPYGVKCIYAHGREEIRDLRIHPDLEHNYASKSSKPISAASCALGTTTAMNLKLKGKRCFTKWDIKRVCQVYADWIDVNQNMCVPLCKVGR